MLQFIFRGWGRGESSKPSVQQFFNHALEFRVAPIILHFAAKNHGRLLEFALERRFVADGLFHIVEELAIGDVALGALELFHDVISQETMLLILESESSFVEVGSSKDADVAAKTHTLHSLHRLGNVDDSFATSVNAVEAAIKDESEVVFVHAVKPAAQSVERQALC